MFTLIVPFVGCVGVPAQIAYARTARPISPGSVRTPYFARVGVGLLVVGKRVKTPQERRTKRTRGVL